MNCLLTKEQECKSGRVRYCKVKSRSSGTNVVCAYISSEEYSKCMRSTVDQLQSKVKQGCTNFRLYFNFTPTFDSIRDILAQLKILHAIAKVTLRLISSSVFTGAMTNRRRHCVEKGTQFEVRAESARMNER